VTDRSCTIYRSTLSTPNQGVKVTELLLGICTLLRLPIFYTFYQQLAGVILFYVDV